MATSTKIVKMTPAATLRPEFRAFLDDHEPADDNHAFEPEERFHSVNDWVFAAWRKQHNL